MRPPEHGSLSKQSGSSQSVKESASLSSPSSQMSSGPSPQMSSGPSPQRMRKRNVPLQRRLGHAGVLGAVGGHEGHGEREDLFEARELCEAVEPHFGEGPPRGRDLSQRGAQTRRIALS